MKNLVIYGSGGLGTEVLELINNINEKSAIWNVVGFYDDYVKKGSFVSSMRVLGGLEDLRQSDVKSVVIAIGNPEVRANLMLSLVEKEFPVLIHPTVVVPEISVSIGMGSIIAANTFISVNTIIEKGVLINVGCSIGHDVEIGKFCTINPGVRVSGTVKMGDAVYVGVGAILNNNITITSGVKIGAGSVLLKSVEKKGTLFGNPARIMLE
jgi:sugar O-acyltransferase (sialic acid O-acetyltransferase NeuD family)